MSSPSLPLAPVRSSSPFHFSRVFRPARLGLISRTSHAPTISMRRYISPWVISSAFNTFMSKIAYGCWKLVSKNLLRKFDMRQYDVHLPGLVSQASIPVLAVAKMKRSIRYILSFSPKPILKILPFGVGGLYFTPKIITYIFWGLLFLKSGPTLTPPSAVVPPMSHRSCM